MINVKKTEISDCLVSLVFYWIYTAKQKQSIKLFFFPKTTKYFEFLGNEEMFDQWSKSTTEICKCWAVSTFGRINPKFSKV